MTKSNWIKMSKRISFGCIIVYVFVLICYFCVFNDGISKESKDWSLFVLIFSGFITTVLTSVNIYCIIQINLAIENNNDKRHIQNTLYEAETILTKMRFDKFDNISKEITDIQVSLFKKKIPLVSIENLKKMLMRMDYSFLFMGQKLNQQTILQKLEHDIVNQIDLVAKDVKKEANVDEQKIELLQRDLSHYLTLLEYHIIAQLLRGNSVQKYIVENKGHVDCTISSIYEFTDEICKKMDQENNKTGEPL